MAAAIAAAADLGRFTRPPPNASGDGDPAWYRGRTGGAWPLLAPPTPDSSKLRANAPAEIPATFRSARRRDRCRGTANRSAQSAGAGPTARSSFMSNGGNSASSASSCLRANALPRWCFTATISSFLAECSQPTNSVTRTL